MHSFTAAAHQIPTRPSINGTGPIQSGPLFMPACLCATAAHPASPSDHASLGLSTYIPFMVKPSQAAMVNAPSSYTGLLRDPEVILWACIYQAMKVGNSPSPSGKAYVGGCFSIITV
jgi:hypothetical protein